MRKYLKKKTVRLKNIVAKIMSSTTEDITYIRIGEAKNRIRELQDKVEKRI